MGIRRMFDEKIAADSPGCPFCAIDPSRVYAANELAFTLADNFPVNPGHTLIVPRRLLVSLFEATEVERAALFDLLAESRRKLLEEKSPDGFNIGINDGAAAGQTVFHLHIHLIPRYVGDCDDPRSGVRKLFPDRASYWTIL